LDTELYGETNEKDSSAGTGMRVADSGAKEAAEKVKKRRTSGVKTPDERASFNVGAEAPTP